MYFVWFLSIVNDGCMVYGFNGFIFVKDGDEEVK